MIAEDTPLSVVRELFSYTALDQMPTPDLDVPGWEIMAETPVSSFREGMEITGYGAGRIQLRIRTTFFAHDGRDPNVELMMGAPARKGSSFQHRRNFPVELSLDAPIHYSGSTEKA